MIVKNSIAVFLGVVILSSCAPVIKVSPTETSVPMSDDFSFVFEEYACGSSLHILNVLDTSTGILVHTPTSGSKPVEIPLVLSESQMEAIYKEILSTNYFDYPAEVRVRGETPTDTFSLKVMNGDLEKEVRWTSDLRNAEPNFLEDDRLVELFYLIRKTIHYHPAYPKPEELCA